MQRYQFPSPSGGAGGDEFQHCDTATSSLIENGKSNVNGNGIFNGGLSGALNSENRARLFKKPSGCGRPVREWYV